MYRLYWLCILSVFALSSSPCLFADELPDKATEKESSDDERSDDASVVSSVLLYIPNRALDLLDIFRLRVRIGPGGAAGIRATKLGQAYIGSYYSLYAGLPGPRRRVLPRLPIGLETYNGVAASVAEATVSGGFGPDYSDTEIGASLHIAILGFDIGFDPWEVVDFLGGVVFLDVNEDDF